MRVITVNVNGIRAAARHGGTRWLAAQQADIITLQEVRAHEPQLRQAIEEDFGDWHLAHAPAAYAGRAGVAILSRTEPLAVRSGLPGLEDDAHSGRWLEADFPCALGTLTVVSTYVHSGEVDTPKQVNKYAFLGAMDQRLHRAATSGEHLLLTGDVNIAHTNDDIKNWKGNLKKAGFLPEERTYLDKWITEGPWIDVHRKLVPHGPGPYTWWSQRGQAFDNDAGWRIDYHLATPHVAEAALTVQVGRAQSYAERWSDHAPVIVDYEV